MRHYIYLMAALIVLTASCGGGRTAAADGSADSDTTAAADSMSAIDSLLAELGDLPMPKAADELFDDFLFNYAANRKLQYERTLFPLRQVANGRVDTIDRKAWRMERFFLPQGYYTEIFDSERHMEVVKDTSVSHASVEKIFFDTQTVRQYHFRRLKGAWMLVEIGTIGFDQSENASFLTFYHQFALSKEFQLQHLADEVAFVGPDPDDDFAMMEGVITPDTWEAFAPELPHKVMYNIIYGKPHAESKSKVFVLRGIANGLELQMTFHRGNGTWKLTKLST